MERERVQNSDLCAVKRQREEVMSDYKVGKAGKEKEKKNNVFWD